MTKKYTPTIAVDFDGVIHSYTSGWKGAAVIPDPPVEGAIEWLARLVVRPDVEVVIFSTRAVEESGRIAIRRWLYRHGFEMEIQKKNPERVLWGSGKPSWMPEVVAEKPPAVAYLDDRGVRFEGTFPDPDALLAMKPWNKS